MDGDRSGAPSALGLFLSVSVNWGGKAVALRPLHYIRTVNLNFSVLTERMQSVFRCYVGWLSSGKRWLLDVGGGRTSKERLSKKKKLECPLVSPLPEGLPLWSEPCGDQQAPAIEGRHPRSNVLREEAPAADGGKPCEHETQHSHRKGSVTVDRTLANF